MQKVLRSVMCAAVVALAAVLPQMAMGANWYVDQTNGKAENGGHYPNDAKANLATVYSSSGDGDVIYVMGTYSISSKLTFNKGNRVVAGHGSGAVIDAQGKCRIMDITAATVVSNLTLKGGVDSSADSSSWSYPPAGVELTKGTLTHCKVTGCKPGSDTYHCSAVRIGDNAVVQYCDIYDNDAGKLNTAYAAGVNVNSSSAKLLHSKIHNCRGRADAIFVVNGLVEDCDVYNNTNYPASELSGGAAAGSAAGARADGGGSRIARCRFYGNYGYGNGGALWLREGSIVENCLIYGNHAEGSGGAIYCNSGNPVIRFCNIGGNTCESSSGYAAISVTSGTPEFKNDIIYGNGSDVTKEIASNNTGNFNYCLLGTTRTGTGNIVVTKSPYVDASAGNYRTSGESEGIDKATEISGVNEDIDGTSRPRDGGTGTVASDIGCVEYVNPKAKTSPIVYLDAAGSNEAPFDTPAKAAHSLLAAVSAVEVSSELGYGEIRVAAGVYESDVDVTLAAAIRVTGTNVASTVFKKTSILMNHADALVSGVSMDTRTSSKAFVVKVTQGTVSNCVVRGFRYEIAKDEDFGGGALVLNGSDVSPKVCRVVDSVISNSVVTLASDRQLKTWDFVPVGAGVAFRGGRPLMQRCLVTDCRAAGNGAGVLCLNTYEGARILDSEISYCHASITDDSPDNTVGVAGGGLYTSGGDSLRVEGCNVHHNYANGCGGGMTIGTDSSLVLNTRITDNEVYAYAGTGLRIETSSGAKAVNCLVARNRRRQVATNGPGVYLKGGILINCTVSENTGGVARAGILCYSRTGDDVTAKRYLSAVRNTIVWGNVPAEWDGESPKEFGVGATNSFANVVVPAFDGVTGTAIINGDPLLKGDYTLRLGSSALNTGSNELYSVETYGDKDLAGKARICNDTIDIGCFEHGKINGMVIFYR